MKLKLTPELSYLIGIWSKQKCKQGFGINGENELQQIFAQSCLEQKLTTSDKLLYDDKRVYFYQGKYKKFFQVVVKEKLERYKYLNDYSASYLAGIFDAVGEISKEGIIYLNKFNKLDDLLFFRLGFPTKKTGDKTLITRPKAFLSFIKNYTKRFDKHPIMKYLKKQKT